MALSSQLRTWVTGSLKGVLGMNSFIKKTVIAFTIGLMAGTTFAHAYEYEVAMTPSKKVNRRPGSMDLSDPKPITSRDIVSTGDTAFAATETFAVRNEFIQRVNAEMGRMGLEEDVDYAWVSKTSNAVVNFVCYSTDCAHWAKARLHVIAQAPNRPEDANYRNAWKDPSIEKKAKAPNLSEEEQIKQRHQLHYKSLKQG